MHQHAHTSPKEMEEDLSKASSRREAPSGKERGGTHGNVWLVSEVKTIALAGSTQAPVVDQ